MANSIPNEHIYKCPECKNAWFKHVNKRVVFFNDGYRIMRQIDIYQCTQCGYEKEINRNYG